MSDTPETSNQKKSHLAEWALVLFGAIVCIGVAALFGTEQMQPIWPVPGFYFIELILIAILGAVSQLAKTHVFSPAQSTSWLSSPAIPWILAGILLPFVILGGFSIGPFLFPAFLAFFLAGVISDWYDRSQIMAHISIAVVFVIAQAGLIVFMNLIAFFRLY